MSQAQCFPFVSGKDASVLILGSMPGQRSLSEQQYYAHPRNAFWPIMANLLGFKADEPYRLRLQYLIQHRIALWDVLHTCFRPGSLDTSIDPGSLVVNDFVFFFKNHAHIRTVFFNGAKAEQLFRRYVLGALGESSANLQLIRLPSTSPANAQIGFSEKLASWQAVKSACA